MSEFTPGPWGCDTLRMVSAHRCNVAQILTTNNDYETSSANARLIAAAPELYEALDRVAREASLDSPDMWNQVEAALAKARGDQ